MPEANPPRNEACVTLDEDTSLYRRIEAEILAALERAEFPKEAIFAVRLALEEAVTNALRHGAAGLPNPRVTLSWRVEPTRVTIVVEDPGPGFNPDAVPDPTAPDRIHLPSGRGIMLMRAFMTRVEFTPPGNRVIMTLDRPSASQPHQRTM